MRKCAKRREKKSQNEIYDFFKFRSWSVLYCSQSLRDIRTSSAARLGPTVHHHKLTSVVASAGHCLESVDTLQLDFMELSQYIGDIWQLRSKYVILTKICHFNWSDVWCCNLPYTSRKTDSSSALERYGSLLSNAPSLVRVRATLAMIQHEIVFGKIKISVLGTFSGFFFRY